MYIEPIVYYIGIPIILAYIAAQLSASWRDKRCPVCYHLWTYHRMEPGHRYQCHMWISWRAICSCEIMEPPRRTMWQRLLFRQRSS